MDVFPPPIGAKWQMGKIRYRCTGQWDGGDFPSYAERTNQTHLIPTDTNHLWPASMSADGNVLPRTPEEAERNLRMHSVAQVWLYFGLLAEFLGLNTVNGTQLHSEEIYSQQLLQLQADCCQKEGDTVYIDGPKVAQYVRIAQSRVAVETTTRWSYLCDCLDLASAKLDKISGLLDDDFRLSVALLGTALDRALRWEVELADPDFGLIMNDETFNYSMWMNAVGQAGILQAPRMMYGWCPSRITQLGNQTLDVGTFYYMSLLKTPDLAVDHETCELHACHHNDRHPAPAQHAHACDLGPCVRTEMATKTLNDILLRTDTYPVLRFDHTDGKEGPVEVSVEPYVSGMPYVAISHVSVVKN